MIHQFKQNGVNVVLDVYSGAVHAVDDVVYDVVAEIDRIGWEAAKRDSFACVSRLDDTYSRQDIQEAMDDVAELVEEGMLFSDDPYVDMAPAIGAKETVVKALCLHVAHDCNLKCRYCFAEEGEYHGKRALMSAEVGRQALDFLVANSGKRRNLEVDFFGGEPLMNWDVVKELVAYGRELEQSHHKKFRFTLTTNGILLNDEIMDYLNENMDNVVLSIDGRQEVHDRMRPTPNGKGSYGLILDKFKKMAELRGQTRYYVRGTFTRENLDFAKDVLHLADEGFQQISIEPVVADGRETYALRDEDLPKLEEQYEFLAREMLAREERGDGFTFFHFLMDLSQGPCIVKRLSGCGSGCEDLAVHPSGDLYPCHQFVGQEEFRMGSVFEGVTRRDLLDRFRGVNVYSKPGCQDCWAKFYCSGGCAANAWQFAHDLHGNYELSCHLERKRLECALMMQCYRA